MGLVLFAVGFAAGYFGRPYVDALLKRGSDE